MSAPPRPTQAYTDAPALHPNLLIGSAHLLFWLLFHPAAWRQHVARVDPALAPDFALADLSRAQWCNPAVRRLVLQSFGIWSVLMNTSMVLALGLGGVSAPEIASLAISQIITVVLLGLMLSVASITAGMLAGYLALGVAYNIGDSDPFSIAAFGVGVIGSLSLSLARRGSPHSIGRQIGAILIGVLVGGGASAVVPGILVAASVIGHGVGSSAMLSIGMSLLPGVALGLRMRRWRRGLIIGLLSGGLVGLIDLAVIDLVGDMPTDVIDTMVASVGYGIIYGLWLSTGFTLAYQLADRIAGSWAGSIAGIMGLSTAYLLTLTADPAHTSWTTIGIGVAAIVLGLTINWWRPVVLYPFLAAWNMLLYRADEWDAVRCPSWLRWHSAFWDEHQRLPLPGLEEHLVLVLERNAAEGQRTLEYLARGHQRWAAQAAQIELDARQLERCATIEAIGHVHPSLAAGELAGPASALLRSFSRISQDAQAALQQASSYNQRLALGAVEDRLDGLLRELTRSSERYADRFRPIAIHWRQVIAYNLRALAETVEQRQEIEAPYVIGVPLTAQQAIFVGRTDISAQIESMLLDRRCPPLLLYGQRRMGKTSLLNNLGRMLPSTIIPLFVDLQGPVAQASDHLGLLATFARAMSAAARQQRDLVLPPLSRQDLAADPFPHFDEWLDTVEQALEDRTALLMLDEFEALEPAFDDRRFDEAAVLGTLRHIIQHRPRFKVLLAGSHMLDEVERWASYLINVPVVRIGYLSEEDTRRLTERPVEDFALRYTREASRRVYTLTRGHPALVQLLCAEIVGLKNAQAPAQRRLATIDDVEAAAPEAQRRGSFFFADIQRNQIDASALVVLRRIAAPGEGTPIKRSVLAHQFPEVLDQALAQLTRRELVEAVDGGYRVRVELIRRWFAEQIRY
jgi:hypothetical protein